MKILQLEGMRFGKLSVVERCATRKPNKSFNWVCRCDCGNICEKSGSLLVKGQTKSCGCLKTEYNSKQSKNRKTNLEILEKIGDTYSCKCKLCNKVFDTTKRFYYTNYSCSDCKSKLDVRKIKSDKRINKVNPPSSGQIKEIYDMRKEGKTWNEIGKHYGISKQAVQDKVNRYINKVNNQK